MKLAGSICSAESRGRSLKRQVLWNHKADLKNWHLMAYNWNKFPEIEPQREAWVLAGAASPRGRQEGACLLILGEKPCHS